jgi:hypothetical protein
MPISHVLQLPVRRIPLRLSFIAALSFSLLGCADDSDKKDGEESSDSSATADRGVGDGEDVITIGDSWMNLGAEGIQFSVEKASGRSYRKYGVGGTRLLDEVIPMQYAKAKSENPDIKTVIMTGGGNDILQDLAVHFQCIDSAFDNNDVCKKRIDEVADRLSKLWAEMGEDGVQDVIIIGYTRKAGILGPLAKSANYSASKIPPLCEMVPEPLRCHVFDSDEYVPSLALRIDGIHPDSVSYDAIGAALWEQMQEWGVRR